MIIAIKGVSNREQLGQMPPEIKYFQNCREKNCKKFKNSKIYIEITKFSAKTGEMSRGLEGFITFPPI